MRASTRPQLRHWACPVLSQGASHDPSNAVRILGSRKGAVSDTYIFLSLKVCCGKSPTCEESRDSNEHPRVSLWSVSTTVRSQEPRCSQESSQGAPPTSGPAEAGSGSWPLGHPEGQGSWPALRQHGHRGKPRALRASVRPGRRAAQGLILSDTVHLSQVQMGCRLGLVDVSAAPPAAHCLWGGLAPCPAVPRGGLCCLRPDPCMSCTLACLESDSSPTLLGRCFPGTWVCSQQGLGDPRLPPAHGSQRPQPEAGISLPPPSLH